MHIFVALLRAVNVGGNGKLPMSDLKALCQEAGFCEVRTYIASGNVIFRSASDASLVRNVLEARLKIYAGKPVGVAIRSHPELVNIVARNPFKHMPGNRVMVIFLDHAATSEALDGITGRAAHETIALGEREIFVHYGQGMAQTKLRIPAAQTGTARNMNTVAKLAALLAN
jgi:uncharacterized protein (DUF1697 family)